MHISFEEGLENPLLEGFTTPKFIISSFQQTMNSVFLLIDLKAAVTWLRSPTWILKTKDKGDWRYAHSEAKPKMLCIE